LHGYTIDEALDALDKYLDKSYLQGMPYVYIIHGKGTGALREAILEFLRMIKGFHVSNLVQLAKAEQVQL